MEKINKLRSGSGPPDWSGDSMHVLVMLRWVLIIAISYLVLFGQPYETTSTSAALFVALYLGSNVVLSRWVARATRVLRMEWAIVVLDVSAVTVALCLSGDAANELFVLYFVVLFFSALLDGVLLAVAAALLIGIAHLYTASTFMDFGTLIQNGYIVRVPFLFAVALFFGNLVQNARSTQRREQDCATRAQRMELLSTVSHDLRNPLGVIDSLAELLLEGDGGELNREQASLVMRIRVSIRQVLHLSNNLIDAERIDLKNFTLRSEACDLVDVVEESLLVASTAAELKRVALKWTLPQHVRWVADAVQIERALSNLLGNAIKFTPAGGEVGLTMKVSDSGVRIEIADSGPGFPETLLEDLGRKHLFGADSKGAGSGLGLYIADAVMKAHGGSLSAENLDAGGALVALSLVSASEVEIAGGYAETYLARTA